MTEQKMSTDDSIKQILKSNPGLKVRKGKNGGIVISNPNAPSPLLNALFKRAGIVPAEPVVQNTEEEKPEQMV